mmetsp:Transcript_36579/g.116418  ORF Transcript_36579/g.116418 Transcript_36579/m.116418 type:complete len:233 (+) Transcript_36579:2815-3513(+)
MHATAKSSEPSSASKGAAAPLAFSTSACKRPRLASASWTSFLASKCCSCSEHCFESLASSTSHNVSLDCSFAKSAVAGPRTDSARDLMSCIRRARNFRASATPARASCSAWAISSQAPRASAGRIAASFSSVNLDMTSASFCTAVSTSEIFSPETCICALRFLSAVSFESSASFLPLSSSLFCRARSSVVQVSEGPSENSSASASFCERKARAFVMAVCALAAAASQTAMAF